MGCTMVELELKKCYVEQLDGMDKQHTENVTEVSDNMGKLTNCIFDVFGLLKQLLQPQMYSQKSMYHQPIMYNSHPPPMYLPTFEDNSLCPRSSAQQPMMFGGLHPKAYQPTAETYTLHHLWRTHHSLHVWYLIDLTVIVS